MISDMLDGENYIAPLHILLASLNEEAGFNDNKACNI